MEGGLEVENSVNLSAQEFSIVKTVLHTYSTAALVAQQGCQPFESNLILHSTLREGRCSMAEPGFRE